MKGYNFTERVRKVLAQSREQAFQLRHEYVGTEHLLLGLISDQEGVAIAVLRHFEIDFDAIRRRIEAAVKTGEPSDRFPETDLPYTSRAKKVLEFSMAEARELNHSYVGTEHLLLGILREEKGIGAMVLCEAGLSLDTARSEILRLLGGKTAGPKEDKAVLNAVREDPDHSHLVEAFNLKPHPEGGYYREVFRSAARVQQGERDRSAVTTIYYLLKNNEASKWHVVQSDEVWHFYMGGSLLLLDYDPVSGALMQIQLGYSASTFAFAHAIAAGHWQAAVALNGACLAGCTVAPGFEFADFRMVRDVAGHQSAFQGVMQGFKHLL